MFEAALALHTYTLRDQRVGQAFRITFNETLCSIALLNTGSYIQGVFGVLRNDGPLYVTEVSTVFEVLVWLHFLNPVRTESDDKRLFVRITYQTGNIIGLFVKSVLTAWTPLLRRVWTEALSTFLL